MGTQHNPKKSAGKPARGNPLEFKVGFEGEPDKPIDVIAYAFDAGGKLLASAAVEEGSAKLTLDPKQARSARIFFVPEHPHSKAGESVTLDMMDKLHAYEVMWQFEPQKKLYELLPVPEVLWKWWYYCSCRVRGRVIKVETSGGVTYENPVCHARVHICEVDRLPWILARLPEELIFRLRDDLIRSILDPLPPIPPFPPIPNPPDPSLSTSELLDPGAIWDRLANVFGGQHSDPQPEPRIQHPESILRDGLMMLFGGQPLSSKSTGMGLEAWAALRSNSSEIVREALIKHVDLIKIYWCKWDWLLPWYHYDCDELSVIETDENGRFDTIIRYPCFGDHPDLYFWVEYSIGGAWTTVYHPSIACNTYWEYECGTEVTIRITDPRVHGCADRPVLLGRKIVVQTIGREVSMGEIYRDSIVPAEKVKEGQVKEGWIHPVKPSPFGGTLAPRVDFGIGLTEDVDEADRITHYRWSYRPLGSTSEADWVVIDLPISRNYELRTPAGSPPGYTSTQISPDTSVLGYFVPLAPELPSNGLEWKVLNDTVDFATAYFDTTALTPGKYELKLELFRKDGTSMERVDLTEKAVEVYEVTSPAPMGLGTDTTALAVNDRLLMDAATGHVVGYRLVLHIDNRECFGNIEDVKVNGEPAGPCGFLEYGSLTENARIAFRAGHPDNFAWFNFWLVRVSTLVREGTTTGLVEAASLADATLPPGSGVNFVRTGDMFSKNITVETLMASGLPAGETPCTRAAFAEELRVYALATDGYDRLSHLDGPRGGPFQVELKAFAITPP